MPRKGSIEIPGAEEGRRVPFLQVGRREAANQKTFVREVKIALETAGMPSEAISGHSFRIRAATAAAKGGATESQIKDMGRWKSREYRGYVQLGSCRQCHIVEGWRPQAAVGTNEVRRRIPSCHGHQ